MQAAGMPILLKNKEQKRITVKIFKNSAIILAKLLIQNIQKQFYRC